ncbi:MAG: helix-turn-helix transcriptional regulator [Haemophilus parainfluenzae]|jgi:transcriptional activator-regulatory protein|uniref:Peptidase S24-like protein n=2 Tax=root TaxID=1 RepID=A0ABP2NV71_HAEPA|nr:MULTISPECIES: helix-turn-helix transcriptional regulator [Haemophilus]DAE14164.1 MAG TPA: Repressor protein CI [Myoviridae sp. ctTDl1]DAN73763.1 MAG TPA: Repressor protein CI [Caudoviricetes sp.]EIJ28618.1 peptidase S24-like protein [Haemophilus parainfluenzae HK2019]MBS6008626.1 helix-turn-helix transcriptional regulator [Haemophilus parahaemolyticus]MDU7970247.1 helix-turn-helix transcriptional regulator [Haemophilus parainfluenzae]
MATLSERLTSLMYEKGISQAELARLIGIKQPSVFKILSGETRNPKKILEIATALNVDPHWLKTGEGDPDPSYRIVEVSEPQNPNTVRIDILDVEASAGNGAYLSPTEQGLLSQEFDLTFFRQQFGRADAKHLKLITVKGDSMAPTLESGDLLYVDISENYFAADGLYVFTFDGQTFIKRLQKVGKEMLVISDNPTYKEWTFTQDDDVFIHGRVIFSMPMKWRKW